MTRRIDSAARWIAATPEAVYAAFTTAGAMERWLPPNEMTGEMLHFDFREGGTYRMRLRYPEAQRGQGKTSEDADDVAVRLTRLLPPRSIEQEVVFEGDDPSFEGRMRMVWTLEGDGDGTLVSIRAEGVPAGIRQEDHVAAMTATLMNLAAFVEGLA